MQEGMMSNFYVHIIESPSSDDLLVDRAEGKLILEALRLINIPSFYHPVKNKKEFIESVHNKMADETVKFQKYPILHISAHGDKEGIYLTDKTQLLWSELKDMFWPINLLMKGQFVLCFSSCQGFSGYKMAIGADKIPFGAIVGPHIDIPWDESAIAFAVFYLRLLKDNNAFTAVTAMNAAAGGNKFFTLTGEDMKEIYIKELDKWRMSQLAEQLKKVN